MATLTREDVVGALGRVDDIVIAEIVATGATREELAEALGWLADDALMATGRRARATGRVARLVEILAALQEDEESLLERSLH